MTFDPSKTTEHTVAEVVDAVTEHPGLAADVLAAERARTDREPRATLVDKIEALQAAESGQNGDAGDPSPAADSEPEAQPQAVSGDAAADEQIGEATGEPREGIDVAEGETATLTGDGTPGQPVPQGFADVEPPVERPAPESEYAGAAPDHEGYDPPASVTPDVESVDLTAESVEAGEPMLDENRGSAPATDWQSQPGSAAPDGE